MLEGIESIQDLDDREDANGGEGTNEPTITMTTMMTTMLMNDLEDWYRAAGKARIALLRCIAAGIGSESSGYTMRTMTRFASWSTSGETPPRGIDAGSIPTTER